MQIPKLQIKKACPAKLQQSRGFAVLFTVLISSIVLAIAIGISSISYQEVALSSLAREGATSFFAADTGAECALYWDIDQDVFNPTGPGGSVACGDNLYAVISNPPSPTTFNLDLNNVTNCAVITIKKDTPLVGDTTIESLGYNVSCGQISLGSPRMVERAIRITYGGGSTGGGGGEFCGDGTCNLSESAFSCPADCAGGPAE